jgi:hypothetical protein
VRERDRERKRTFKLDSQVLKTGEVAQEVVADALKLVVVQRSVKSMRKRENRGHSMHTHAHKDCREVRPDSALPK